MKFSLLVRLLFKYWLPYLLLLYRFKRKTGK